MFFELYQCGVLSQGKYPHLMSNIILSKIAFSQEYFRETKNKEKEIKERKDIKIWTIEKKSTY